MSIKSARSAQAKPTKSGGESTASLFELLAKAGMYYAPPKGSSAATISREMTVMSWRMYGWDRGYDSPEEEAADTALQEEEAFLREVRNPSFIETKAEAGHDGIEIVAVNKVGGPLTKRIGIDENGHLDPDGSACIMSAGYGRRVKVETLAEFASMISGMASDEGLILGRLRLGLPDKVIITTEKRLARINHTALPGFIARATEYIGYRPSAQALALLDHDSKGMPDDVRARIKDAGGFWPALCSVLPVLVATARVVRRSTSAGLSRSDTGEEFFGSQGQHVYLHVADGSDIERFLRVLHNLCWLAGYGWHVIDVAGKLHSRSLIDRLVGGPERLVFEGAPVLEPPLRQDRAARAAVAHEGAILDTHASCRDLRLVDATKVSQLEARSKESLASQAATVREDYVARKAEELAERCAIPLTAARQIITRQCDGVLRPDVTLTFDDPRLVEKTVGDVLADPAFYAGETLADPLEGISYGRCKAQVMWRAGGVPWINSYAHGGQTYKLCYDLKTALAAVNAAGSDEVISTFEHVVMNGDLDAAEEEELRDLVHDLTGTGKRVLTLKLRMAREAEIAARRAEWRQRHAAERRDTRPQHDAPLPDEEWQPVMDVLNDVMGASEAPEPPMRNSEGYVTQVQERRVAGLHLLTAAGVNEGDATESRLPAPEQPLLTQLSEEELGEFIEDHIEFIKHSKDDDIPPRPVHLSAAFVRHYRRRSDGCLPAVNSVATLPLVTLDGRLMGDKPGLDRETGVVFRVPEEVLAYLPKSDELTDEHVARSMAFLTDEWLCDVLADYTNKAILITAPLTIMLRALLPQRPTYTLTSGRRGGGKTTTLQMIVMVATGHHAAATPWSPDSEERRKILLGYLRDGVPLVIFDNMRRGTQWSCSHIEAASTSHEYSDRVLGETTNIKVHSACIFLFTGNNVGPKADSTSRNFTMELKVERVDPENRSFKHSDPIGWTEAHRGEILRALYTILLANPYRHREAKTRFKAWQQLIGSAVEHATAVHAAAAETARLAAWEDTPADPPVAVDFSKVAAAQEQEDEEGVALAASLSALKGQFKDKDGNHKAFTAAELAKFLEDTNMQSNDAEKVAAETVRGFFFPRQAAGERITSDATTRRLKTRVGEPALSEGKTLILHKDRNEHDKILRFWVETKD